MTPVIPTPEQLANRARWIADLQSGKYSKTKGYLHLINPTHIEADYPSGYCCLGVSAVTNGIKEEECNRSVGEFAFPEGPSGISNFETTLVPLKFLEKTYGLTEEEARVLRGEVTSMNDLSDTFESVINHLKTIWSL